MSLKKREYLTSHDSFLGHLGYEKYSLHFQGQSAKSKPQEWAIWFRTQTFQWIKIIKIPK